MLVILDTQSNIHLMLKIANDLRGDLNTGIFFPSADTIAFTEGGSEAMRIDSSGNVGIGTTTAGSKLEVVGGITVPNEGGGGTYRAKNSSGTIKTILALSNNAVIADGTRLRSGGGGVSIEDSSGNVIVAIVESASERMRIDSSGRLLVGTTVQSIGSTQSGEIKSSGATGFAIVNTTAANNPLSVLNEGTAGTRRLIQFLEGAGGGTVRGFISTDGSTVAYNTTSDYRLKENVNYNFDATTRLKQLKPARFNFIGHSNRIVDGFLAHEVSDIIPEATTGIKDATETKEKVVVNIHGKIIDENIEQADWESGKILNEEGKSQYPVDSTWEASKVVPVYQAIDQAKLTPILTKALQEAIARIEQLEARLTALES